MIKSTLVCIENKSDAIYPSIAPFDPSEDYPELPFTEKVQETNTLFGMVRNILRGCRLDEKNAENAYWNPFGELVQKGQTVFIKPNLAKHEHRLGKQGLLSTITHGSVIRPLIDYAYKAVGPEGKIIVGDTPFEHTEWDKMMAVTGIGTMVNILRGRGYPLELLDLRMYQTRFKAGMRKTERYEKNGDPLGYLVVDLRDDSEFHELDSKKQNYHTLADHTVDHYDPYTTEEGVTNKHHHPGKHEYLVGKSILSADLIINVPKLKTHGKTGVTLNLKNMIGIVSGKEYMPHHRPGKPPRGDAFPTDPDPIFIDHRFKRRGIAERFGWIQKVFPKAVADQMIRLGQTMILEPFFPVKQCLDDRIEWGDWHGNNTLWRTILDLNKVVLYADKNGVMRKTTQRNYFSVIDGILGQEGQGPTNGKPVDSMLLIGGFNPVYVDTVACLIMGLDPNKITVMANTRQVKSHWLGAPDVEKIELRCNGEFPSFQFDAPGDSPRAWKGSIELTDRTLIEQLAFKDYNR